MGHVDCDLGSFPDVCGGRLTVGRFLKIMGSRWGIAERVGASSKSGAMVV